jgi:hypothetical protein
MKYLRKYRVIYKSLRNFRTRLHNNQDRHSRKELSRNCKVGQRLGSVSPSVDMLPYGVTNLAAVPQRSDIPEGHELPCISLHSIEKRVWRNAMDNVIVTFCFIRSVSFVVCRNRVIIGSTMFSVLTKLTHFCVSHYYTHFLVMLVWPCIMNYVYNNHLNALFILSLLNYHTSTYFGCISSPSSGARMYIYDIYIFNRDWVDTRWQQHSTHLHTNSTHNTENGTYITIKKLNIHNNNKLTNLGSAANSTCYTSKLTVSGSPRPADSQLDHLPHIYVLSPDDWLPIHPKHVEVW